METKVATWGPMPFSLLQLCGLKNRNKQNSNLQSIARDNLKEMTNFSNKTEIEVHTRQFDQKASGRSHSSYNDNIIFDLFMVETCV